MAQLLHLTGLSDKQREYLTALETSADNLLALINDILDLARIEAGKMVLEERVFSLRSCIDEVLAAQRYAIERKGLTTHIDCDPQLPAQLRGDPLRFKQVLLNLVGNAVKFTETGGITVRVRVESSCEQEVTLRVSVIDTGIGITEAVRQKLFAPFEQGDASTNRKYGGSGLGLSICKRLVEMMHGRIEVESLPGSGSTFSIFLPFAVEAVPGKVEKKTPEKASTLCALRVLVAEDNEINRRLLELLLRQIGHEVVSTAHGQAALDCWQKERFDVVLMDIQMPGVDGITALQRIRGDEAAVLDGHQHVIALTAHAMAGSRERLLEVGFDDCLHKPFGLRQLIEVLERVPRPEPSSVTV